MCAGILAKMKSCFSRDWLIQLQTMYIYPGVSIYRLGVIDLGCKYIKNLINTFFYQKGPGSFYFYSERIFSNTHEK